MRESRRWSSVLSLASLVGCGSSSEGAKDTGGAHDGTAQDATDAADSADARDSRDAADAPGDTAPDGAETVVAGPDHFFVPRMPWVESVRDTEPDPQSNAII